MKRFLTSQPGFIAIERLTIPAEEGKDLNLSFWKSYDAIEAWRTNVTSCMTGATAYT